MRDKKQSETSARRKNRKKRRWLVWLARVLLLVGVIVAVGPWMLSTAPGNTLLAKIISDASDGAVTTGKISISWTGPCRVSQVKVIDDSGREVFVTETVEYAGGLLGLLLDRENLDALTVDKPAATVYLEAEDEDEKDREKRKRRRISLSDPIAVPFIPAGDVTISGGVLTLVQPDGRQYVVDGIEMLVSLDANQLLTGSVEISLPGDGRLTAGFELAELFAEGMLNINGAKGSFQAASTRAIPIKPISDFAASEARLTGDIEFDLKGNLKGGELRTESTTTLNQLASDAAGEFVINPLDVTIINNSVLTDRQATGEGSISSQAGRFDWSGKWDLETQGHTPDTEAIIAAIFGSQSLELPDFALDASGSLDVPRLAAAVPTVLKLLPDTEVTSGTFTVEQLAIRGGVEPSVEARAALKEFIAERHDRVIQWQPISLSLKAGLLEKAGLKIDRFQCVASFAQFEGSGTSSDLQLGYETNLGKFYDELAGLVEIPAAIDRPTGRLTGSVLLARTQGDRIDFAIESDGSGVSLRYDKRVIEFLNGKSAANGQVSLTDGKPVRVDVESLSVTVDDQLVATGMGWGDLKTGQFEGKFNLQRGELAKLTKWAQVPGDTSSETADYSGVLSADISVSRSAADQRIVSAGWAKVRQLAVDGELIGDGAVDMEYSGLSLAADRSRADLASASLTSQPLRMKATDVRVNLADKLQSGGSIELVAELADCIAAAQPLAKWDDPPGISGKLNWSVKTSTQGEKVQLTGGGTITQLAVVTDGESLSYGDVSVEHTLVADQAAQQIEVQRMTVDSLPLKFQLAGLITRPAEECLLDLKGSYQGQWKHLLALVYSVKPELKENVQIIGTTGGDILITGPARRPELSPTFGELVASGPAGWDRASFFGVAMDKAQFAPRLADGKLNTPVTEIPSDGGTIRIGGTIDFTGEHPMFLLPGKVQVLQSVPVSADITRKLLSRINPIFSNLAVAGGRLSLEIEDIEFPLTKDAAKTGGSGKGFLDLSEMSVTPEGAMRTLLEMGGVPIGKTVPVTTPGVHFYIKDGRIYYDNFTLLFPGEFDLIFRGSVGFDDTVDVTATMPVKSGLFEKYGIGGPIGQYAALLKGVRVEVPLTGSRLMPKLDLSKIDIAKLVNQALKAMLKSPGKAIEGVLKGPDAKKTPDAGSDGKETSPLDVLFDLLEETQKKSEKENRQP